MSSGQSVSKEVIREVSRGRMLRGLTDQVDKCNGQPLEFEVEAGWS